MALDGAPNPSGLVKTNGFCLAGIARMTWMARIDMPGHAYHHRLIQQSRAAAQPRSCSAAVCAKHTE